MTTASNTHPHPLSTAAKQNTAPASIGTRAARGMAWMTGATLLLRMLSLVAQLVLARVLLKDEFGVYGLALTVWGFVQLLGNPGLDDVLVSRSKNIHLWISPAFWMSISLGAIGNLVMLAAAPIAAWAYDDPRVLPVMAAMAPAAILAAPQVVAGALVRAGMRFRLFALFMGLTNLVLIGGQVVCAYLGLGVLAFAIPIPLSAFLGSVMLWVVARPRVRRTAHMHQWRFLFGDSIALLIVRLLYTLQAHGDRMILGLMSVTGAVGAYFFAFQLSMQATRLFAANLSAVLFPSLSTLRDQPERQALGALNASRLLAFVGMPTAFLQAALAEPVLRLFFDHKWDEAILPAQLLSVAMGFDCIAWPGGALMQAQRRFVALARVFAASVAVFLIAVFAGAFIAGSDRAAIGVAAAAAIYYTLVPAIILTYALTSSGIAASRVLAIYPVPLLCSALAIGMGWYVADRVPQIDVPYRDLARIGATCTVSLIAYAVLTGLLARHLWHDLYTRARLVLASRS